MRAVFLDRDGVINEDHGYIHKVEDLEILPGVIDGLKLLQHMGFVLIIVTNQSGIGRGFYTKEQYDLFHTELLKRLGKEGIQIDKTYMCPHQPTDGCDCRKPSPKHAEDAEQEFGISLADSYIIGDHASDIGFGRNSGMTTVHILTGHGKKHGDIEADHQSEDFEDAVAWIEQIELQKA
ncbi:MAG: HAD family hydrolase [archaeon]